MRRVGCCRASGSMPPSWRAFGGEPQRRPAAARCRGAGADRRPGADRRRRADLGARPRPAARLPRSAVCRGGGGRLVGHHGQPRGAARHRVSTGCCGSTRSPSPSGVPPHDHAPPHHSASGAAIAAQPRADRLPHRARHRLQRHAAARRGEGAHGRARELRQHDLRHRSHRRRAQRQHPAAAVFGVPHRQRDQQRHLEELRGHRQASRGGVDRAAVAGRQPSRLPRARHDARLFRALQVPPRARPDVRFRRPVQGPVRRRDRRRCGEGARL